MSTRQCHDQYAGNPVTERNLSRVGIAATLVASAMLAVHLARTGIENFASRSDYWSIIEVVLFAVIMSILIYGALLYQIARIGYFARLSAHEPVPHVELDRMADEASAPLCILVPALKEEAHVVRQTLLSAALLDYPRKRVVLLIDDPPDGGTAEERRGLDAMRALPLCLTSAFRQAGAPFREAADAGETRITDKGVVIADEFNRLAAIYAAAAAWLEGEAERFLDVDCGGKPNHTDRFFANRVLRDLARKHRNRATEFADQAGSASEPSDAVARLGREYRQVASLFDVEFTSFERKRFENLSNAPNKAMNLNSYIGLMGNSFMIVETGGGLHLVPHDGEAADLVVPSAKYLINLDADSLVMSDYAKRLVYVMEKKGNERLAVAQTPYSAVPGAVGQVERVAGATTDIQYIVHQGFTRHDASYWVGANALLRLEALKEIATVFRERGFSMKMFIQDRTVIEDTESSIDLVDHGWTLYNYPERLAFSATPPDFGSLLIQRRRWSNGGLIIVPKLFRYLVKDKRSKRLVVYEFFMRFHYLTSPAGVSTSIILLLYVPFNDAITTVWLALTAAPYFYLYGRDLTHIKYKWLDLVRVYALNLLLVPVIMGGVLKSIQQMITGRKTPFGRTPKVSGRTATPRLYVAIIIAIVLGCIFTFGYDLAAGRLLHAAFSFFNGGLFGYALFRYVVFPSALHDLIGRQVSIDQDFAKAFSACAPRTAIERR